MGMKRFLSLSVRLSACLCSYLSWFLSVSMGTSLSLSLFDIVFPACLPLFPSSLLHLCLYLRLSVGVCLSCLPFVSVYLLVCLACRSFCLSLSGSVRSAWWSFFLSVGVFVCLLSLSPSVCPAVSLSPPSLSLSLFFAHSSPRPRHGTEQVRT